jgi:ornithine carbamoyltransferase
MQVQHFLTLNDFSKSQLEALLNRAIELKSESKRGLIYEPLKNKTLAMMFSKSSTRTRVSFQVGMNQLGGSSIELKSEDTQMGRGESMEDSARVISSMVDGVLIRTDKHQIVELFSEHSSVPVINGLTDDFHPCQLLADLQTWQELRGNFQGATAAWVGDGNNVCHSWMNAAGLLGFKLNIATPKGYEPRGDKVALNPDVVQISNNPQQAVENADVVITDTWFSMGDEDQKQKRIEEFSGFCVDDALMARANSDALFMHCLPAYRGYEMTSSVFEGEQSVVFQEAENRLHAQKALLELLL